MQYSIPHLDPFLWARRISLTSKEDSKMKEYQYDFTALSIWLKPILILCILFPASPLLVKIKGWVGSTAAELFKVKQAAFIRCLKYVFQPIQ